MNIQNVAALNEKLQLLGFGDIGAALLKRICFKLVNFFLTLKIEKGSDQLSFHLFFEKDKKQNEYFFEMNPNAWVKSSVPTILSLWHTIVTRKLNPLNSQLLLFADDNIQYLIDESESEKERVQSQLIAGVIDRPKIRDKQEYIQINQALLIRLLDKMYSYQQNKILSEKTLYLYKSLSQHLQQTLDFIEDFFGNYFDLNEKVPDAYLNICKDDITQQLKKINSIFAGNDTIDKDLSTIIAQHFYEFVINITKPVTYRSLAYKKDFLHELLTEKALESTKAIRETLYYLNFNEDNFIAYEYNRLKQLIDLESTKKEKIDLLRFEQKSINQQTTRLNCIYSKNMPPLKEQINSWINEEIRFLESVSIPENIENSKTENDNKIHTSLSVAKLALLIRLLVIDKIIINRTVAPMLRIVAKIFTTLKKEEISFGSLETKYHAPDRTTINAVKDMLFKWINILGKL